jgi:hypothetical protein
MRQHFQARGLNLTRLRLLRDAAGHAGLAAEGPAHENVLWRRLALDFISVSGFPCAIILAFQLLDSVVGMIGMHSLSRHGDGNTKRWYCSSQAAHQGGT